MSGKHVAQNRTNCCHDKIEKDVVGGTYRRKGENRNAYRVLVRKPKITWKKQL
jgi:hypothetical protein